MKVLRAIPNKVLFAVAALLPLVLFFRFGEEKGQLLVTAAIGVLLAWFAHAHNIQKQLFIALIATLLFSVEIPVLGGSAISLPAEPLALLLATATLFSLAKQWQIASVWLKEPLLWAVGFLIFIWIVSAALSGMVEVSLKYVFINLVFIGIGFFAFPLLWQTQGFSILTVVKILAIPIFVICVYSLVKLAPYNFNPKVASLMAQPFFKDHTVFSATFSLFLPLLLLWKQLKTKKSRIDWLFPLLGVFMLFVLLISSSRAAWIAVLVAAVFYFFVRFGGTLRILGIFSVLLALALWINADALKNKFFVNTHTSTEVQGGLEDQALSVTNISSDVSNLERLNRWSCALRMGLDKPLTGYGPGTYQFEYLPYQLDNEITYISVTSPFDIKAGRGGSAHSEYLLLLSESGFAGLSAWVLLQLALLFSFFKIWGGKLAEVDKNIALAVYLSVLTYTVHSFFNNYLNNAQFGISWWMMVGALFYLAQKNRKAHHEA